MNGSPQTKIDRFAAATGLIMPTTTAIRALIEEYLFSERDRFLITRYIIDGVPVGTYLLDEVNGLFPYAPLDENGMRKAIRRCLHRISKHA